MADNKALKIPKVAQQKLIAYAGQILTASASRQEMYAKMEAIDKAYARYQAGSTEEGATPCGDLFSKDKIVAPIVVSQVDSLVGYLSEVFLSGYPIFPVVSTPAKRQKAEQLEALIDDHAMLGGYARQLLMFLRDAVKYNIGAIEADWDSLEQYDLANDWRKDSPRLDKSNRYMTVIKRLDLYNTIWDDNVLPGDVAEKGDYAGYIEIISRMQLKRLCNKLTIAEEAYNVQEVLNDRYQSSMGKYVVHPDISASVTARRPSSRVDWDSWFGDTPTRKTFGSGEVEKLTLYARIIPSDFGIIGPSPNTPQIWKLIIINGKHLLHARRIISAYDRLPILFGQPMEDGFGLQTQSVAEGQVPIQEAATTLFNMRFAAARRAVSDRALFNPNMIKPDDINSAAPAPKIPVMINPLNKEGFANAYMQIPFDLRGTETAFQDAAVLVDFSKQLSGLNSPQQGQFQKGNKSVQEWNDTMGGSDSRLRLPALCLEYQVFIWLKFIIMLNIYQYGDDAVVVSQRSGETLSIKMEELRKEVLSFKIADGYSPKSKMASTDMLVNGMTLLMNSPILQQSYGTMLPQMFAHMMQLGGVRGLEEYAPEKQPQAPGLVAPAMPAANPADPSMQPLPGQAV